MHLIVTHFHFDVLPVFSDIVHIGYDSRGGGGRRPFGSGFRRDYDDSRGSGDRYGDRDDRYDKRDDRHDRREDRYDRRDERREERGGFDFLSYC